MLTAKLRLASPSEYNFIYGNWLKHYRSEIREQCPNEIFFKEHHKIIEAILKRSQVMVAHDQDDTDHFFGFAVYEKHEGCTILHFVFVKDTFRRLGVATKLLADLSEPFFYTHWTKRGVALLSKRISAFNPYLLFEGFKWQE